MPVIVMTSSNDPSDRAVCLDLGASTFLCKPLQEAELRKVFNL